MHRGVGVWLVWLAPLLGCGACEQEAPPAPPAPPVALATPDAATSAEPEAPSALVTNKNGKVEVSRSAGTWRELNVGDKLSANDAVRTAEDAELEITVSDVRVRVRERSELKVKKISQRALRAQLRGHLESNVPKGSGVVEIEAENSDALVRSEGGKFSMTADARGMVAVATVNGHVDLSAAGRVVGVEAGQVSRVRPGNKPEEPKIARRSVLLNVDWPERKETNRRTIPLKGRVEAGSRVLVQGQPVEVDQLGNFKTEVALRYGRQKVAVTAVDVLGRRRQQDTSILQDDKLPNIEAEKLWRQR